MTLWNYVLVKRVCPACNAEEEFRFEIESGDLVRAALKIGDTLPTTNCRVPEGQWSETGFAICYSCGQYLEATCRFDTNRIVSVEESTLFKPMEEWE